MYKILFLNLNARIYNFEPLTHEQAVTEGKESIRYQKGL